MLHFAPKRTPAEKAFLACQYRLPHRYEAMASERENFFSPDGSGGVDARQSDLAARSARGRSRLVEKTSHFIRADRPETIIRAVVTIVSEVRDTAGTGTGRPRGRASRHGSS